MSDDAERIKELEAEVKRLNSPIRTYYEGYNAKIDAQAVQIAALRSAIEQHLTFDCFGGKADNLRKLLYETTPKTKDDPDAPPKG
jgi:hypothetical protein